MWWIVTAGADIYPEELAVGVDILEVVFGDDEDRPSRRLNRQIHGFVDGGLTVLPFLQAREAADRDIPGGGVAVPVEGEGAAPILPIAMPPGAAPVGPPDAGETMAEVRVLAVHWQNGDRYQPFKEVVPQLREFRFAGDGLEGDLSILEYLKELSRTGTTPTVRSRAWASDTLSSAADRSGFEHFTLSKVLEVALECDQLNVACIAAFEICARRLQLIEYAHSANPGNPDYTLSDFYMGFASKRGSVIVSKTLAKHVAAKAAERSSTLKESRKFAEEQRLRKKGKGDGKGKDDKE